jgi:hypothetical protein
MIFVDTSSELGTITEMFALVWICVARVPI